MSRNGQVCLWEASIDSDDLVTSAVQISHKKRRKLQKEAELEDDEVDEEKVIEKDKEYVSVTFLPIKKNYIICNLLQTVWQIFMKFFVYILRSEHRMSVNQPFSDKLFLY